MQTLILPAFAFFFGACVGSFLNVCIARWPAGLSVVSPPSRCPSCERPIRWYENVPLLGWLALRARCAGCGERISAVYPAVELLVGLGWLAAYLAFGPTFEALRVAVFGTVLLGIASTDARHYLIPDGFTVFLLLWSLGTSIASTAPGGTTLFAGPYEAFVGACVGAGAISIIGWLGELAFKKEAMGFGDVTMMAAVGAALGAERALLTVVTGAFLGAIASLAVILPVAYVLHRRAGAQVTAGGSAEGEGGFEPPLVPFGVFLAPAALLTLLRGDDMIAWYFTRFLQQ
jgi:leader peptidase (prepilin peptidase)/N-methyltransferase